MPSWTTSETVQRFWNCAVPVWADHGANWNEVYSAIDMAHRKYKELYGRDPSGDAIRVIGGDEEIIIRFELPAPERAAQGIAWAYELSPEEAGLLNGWLTADIGRPRMGRPPLTTRSATFTETPGGGVLINGTAAS